MSRKGFAWEERLARHMDELKWLYMELYDSPEHFEELIATMRGFYDARKPALKRQDKKREEDPAWFKKNGMLGMMMYAGNFGGTLAGVGEKLDYIKRCGVNYLHLMPLLESPAGRSDGGYAVADFRKVQEELGTIEDLEALADKCRRQGISICLDFVMNHTSEDHEWARRARNGERSTWTGISSMTGKRTWTPMSGLCPRSFPPQPRETLRGFRRWENTCSPPFTPTSGI